MKTIQRDCVLQTVLSYSNDHSKDVAGLISVSMNEQIYRLPRKTVGKHSMIGNYRMDHLLGGYLKFGVNSLRNCSDPLCNKTVALCDTCHTL